MTIARISTITVSALALLFTACGGGGGGGGAGSGGGSFGPNLIGGDLNYQPGVFNSAGSYKNFCQTPRTGTNDQSGSNVNEKFWLRSWSNETYLWYNELPDIDPNNSQTPLQYFDELRTTATTASGNPKDRFHFTYDTEEYQQLVNSGASAGYGARFRLISGAPPRQVVVAYVEAGSPAAAAGLKRGAEIIEIDGTAVVDGDPGALNAGLFPDGEGESHTFVFQNVGATTTESVTIVSDIVAAKPVHTTDLKTLSNGRTIGYMLFNTFGTAIAEEALADAINTFSAQSIDQLVLDLRYNGGGFLDISAQLGYMIAGPNRTNGRVYETLVFNDKNPTTNPVTGNPITPTPFHSTGQGFSLSEGILLPDLDLDTVYILSSASTCSASESLINSLLGIDVNVVMIGTTSCGKPYGFYGTDNCGTTYFTIQFRGENDKGFGDYADGFSPFEGAATTGEPVNGCIVGDDFSKELGDSTEAMLAAALTHMETGACPTNVSAKPQSFVRYEKPLTFEQGNLLADPRIENRLILENSRILTER